MAFIFVFTYRILGDLAGLSLVRPCLTNRSENTLSPTLPSFSVYECSWYLQFGAGLRQNDESAPVELQPLGETILNKAVYVICNLAIDDMIPLSLR